MADEKEKAVPEKESAAKPARRKKTEPGKGARASPGAKDKTAEIPVDGDPKQTLSEAPAEEKQPKPEVTEQVVLLPLDQLKPFKDHPFKVKDDDSLMQDTIDSILSDGVINPILVRPAKEGGYEIVSGHRRCRASELAGFKTIKAIVREMDDDTAIITMVNSNLQRENILPSERAYAYKMKLNAMKRQGARTDLTSGQVGQKLRSVDVLASSVNESAKQVQRYIRLTKLIPELMDMVDNKQISFNPAVELSYLYPTQQRNFIQAMDYAQAAPSLSQAQRIKKLAQEGKCTLENMCDIMNEEKKGDLTRVTIGGDVLRKYFPKNYTPRQMEQTIIKLLENWQKQQKRDKER